MTRFTILLAAVLSAVLGAGCPGGSVGGTGGGAASAFVPGAPGGMAGPPGASSSGISSPSGVASMNGAGGDPNDGDRNDGDGSDGGDVPGGGAERKYVDPTSGAETPVTVLGTPSGYTPKNPECLRVREVRICLGQVRVEVEGESDSLGRLPYVVSGGLYAKINGGPLSLIPSVDPLEIFDLLHPEAPVGTTGIDSSGFRFLLKASVGRPIRLQKKFCGRVTRLDLTTPEFSQSPLLLDPCGAPTDTDEPDPDWKPVETPPDFPPTGTLPVNPLPPKSVPSKDPPPAPEPEEEIVRPSWKELKNWRGYEIIP